MKPYQDIRVPCVCGQGIHFRTLWHPELNDQTKYDLGLMFSLALRVIWLGHFRRVHTLPTAHESCLKLATSVVSKVCSC